MFSEASLITVQQQTEKKYGAIDDAVIRIDFEGVIVGWDEIACEIFGYSEAEAIGSRVGMLIPPERSDDARRLLRRVRKGRRRTQFRTLGRKKDGRECDILITVIPDGEDQRSVVVEVPHPDATLEQKTSEIERSLLAAIVDSSCDAIFSVDFDGTITSWNLGAERLFGHFAENAIGQPATILIPSDRMNEEYGCLNDIRAGRRIEPYETIRQRKDGSLVEVLLTISPLIDASGRVFGASKIARDISRRKSAERNLEVSNAQLAEFSRRMSRDLRAAAAVQQSFVPHPNTEFESIDFAWAFRPCDELAGDGLNIVPFEDGKFGLYVLDVCGHGVAPALLSVAMSRILLRHSAGNHQNRKKNPVDIRPATSAAPAQIGELLTELFPFEASSQQFATITYGVLDPNDGEFRFITAGHPGPAIVPVNGKPRVVEATGFPIGIGDGDYDEYSLTLQPGDRLYLYSDGILEVPNDRAEQFGKERMLESLHRSRGLGLQESIDSLLDDLIDWYADDHFPDDMSILAIEMPSCHRA